MSKNIQTIMVGIDFSDCTDHVVQFAVQLAEQLGGRLHLVHVHVPTPAAAVGPLIPDPMPLPQLEPDDEALRRMQAALQTLADRLVQGRVPTVTQVYIGDASLSLRGAIEQIKPDLVVVGSHGRGVLMRLLLGSVSTYVSQHSAVPVMIVPNTQASSVTKPVKGRNEVESDAAVSAA